MQSTVNRLPLKLSPNNGFAQYRRTQDKMHLLYVRRNGVFSLQKVFFFALFNWQPCTLENTHFGYFDVLNDFSMYNKPENSMAYLALILLRLISLDRWMKTLENSVEVKQFVNLRRVEVDTKVVVRKSHQWLKINEHFHLDCSQ